MNNKARLRSIYCTILAALLLSPLGLMAQEDAEPTGKAVAQAKLAIELGVPFGDNMILQREMDLPVWGWSKPGTKITVEFAGQKQQAEAGKDGKWMLKLKPLKASAEPAEMTITGSDGKKGAHPCFIDLPLRFEPSGSA